MAVPGKVAVHTAFARLVAVLPWLHIQEEHHTVAEMQGPKRIIHHRNIRAAIPRVCHFLALPFLRTNFNTSYRMKFIHSLISLSWKTVVQFLRPIIAALFFACIGIFIHSERSTSYSHWHQNYTVFGGFGRKTTKWITEKKTTFWKNVERRIWQSSLTEQKEQVYYFQNIF